MFPFLVEHYMISQVAKGKGEAEKPGDVKAGLDNPNTTARSFLAGLFLSRLMQWKRAPLRLDSVWRS